MHNSKYALRTHQLTKSFRSFKKKPGIKGTLQSFVKRDYTTKNAVDGFDVTIKHGEFIGLLGPNGAGKTTLMKMLTGIIVPSSGDIEVLGYTPSERHKIFRKKIALVMGQKSQLWWDIPAMDSFKLLQKYYEVTDQNFKNRVEELSELLAVKDLLHIHVRKLSLGERMKLELMACLLHEPEIIFLDEPTIGLDLVAQKRIREFLASYHKKNNCSVILTSHYMADVEALCERIVLIIDGKNSFDGSIHEFQNVLGRKKFVQFRFSEKVDNKASIWKDLDPEWNPAGNMVNLRIDESQLREKSQEILQSFPVSDFQTDKMPIERVMNTLLTRPDLVAKSAAQKAQQQAQQKSKDKA